jgi:predicted CxxxxCH...CXXCH cytochrome family protein
MMRRAFWLVAVGASLALAACEPPPLADGKAVDDIDCRSCHGGEDNAAPPNAIAGGDTRASVGVGAHQAHLRGGDFRAGIACDECHVVPETVEAPGHVDALPAELAFGRLAAARGQAPQWMRAEASCSNVACHGSGLAGGRDVKPIWTQVGVELDCDSCHGNPPPLPHPPATDCARCHSQTATIYNEIILETGRHIDGVIDVDAIDCLACHGSFGTPAPPTGVSGENDASQRAVGAHRSHLRDAAWHAPVACDECHVVPATVDAPGHMDTAPPAELTWGSAATARGATPMFDGVGCSNVACHGAGLAEGNGSNTEPRWTVIDGTQAACGTCHATPPGGNHPGEADCSGCHSEVMSSATEFLRPDLHVDGVVQVVGGNCVSCHGGESDGFNSPAPPLDTQGNSATTERGVGAHRSHLRESDWRAAVTCDECHAVPSTVDAPGHNDTALPAELTWGDRPQAGDVMPLFDGLNCTVYCHGASLSGGSNTSPAWTTVDGTQAACGTCHGNPPPAPHPVATPMACGGCHPSDPALHINGMLDLP